MRIRAPFSGVYEPLVERAVAALRIHSVGHASDSVFDDAAQALASDLSSVVAPTLFAEFVRVPGRAWLDRDRRDAHDRFVDAMRDGGWDSLVERQPALDELTRRVIGRWSARYERALRHIADDRDVLAAEFAVHAPVSRAAQLAETTMRIGDAHGNAAIYKNRRVALDVAWAELLRWFNGCAPRYDLLVPVVVDRGDHGYADVVTPASTTDDLLHVRWHRTGALLCLVHLLGGGDAHEGNVMVCGEHVVLIDAEKVMRPGLAGDDGDEASVLMTGLLPSRPTYLRCGLVSELFQPRPQRWFNVGTDAIRHRPSGALMSAIRPRVDELFATHADRMTVALVAGFRDAARIVRRHGLPVELFEHAQPRLIVRNSQEYLEAIDAMVQPDALGDPAALGRAIDAVVGRPPFTMRGVPDLWPAVAEAERESLRFVAIPRFSVWATGDELVYDGRVLGRAFVSSPLQRSLSFVRRFSDDAVERQLDTIRWSIEGARRGDFAGGVARSFVLGGDLAASI